MKGGFRSATLAMFVAATNAWALDAVGVAPTSQIVSTPIASTSPLAASSGVKSAKSIYYFETTPCPVGGAHKRPAAHRRVPARIRPVVIHVPTAYERLKARVRPSRFSTIPTRPAAPTHCEILHQGPFAQEPDVGPALLPVVDAALEPAALVLPEGAVVQGGGVYRPPDNGSGNGGQLTPPSPPIGGGGLPVTSGGSPSRGGGGVSAAPEPDVWALMLVGVATLGGVLRRRRQAGADVSAGPVAAR